MEATLCSPSRSLWIRIRAALHRVNCGRRFGHFPVEDSFGYPVCSRCGCPLL